MSVSRSAEDTIKGFNYQFAATFLLILQAEKRVLAEEDVGAFQKK